MVDEGVEVCVGGVEWAAVTAQSIGGEGAEVDVLLAPLLEEGESLSAGEEGDALVDWSAVLAEQCAYIGTGRRGHGPVWVRGARGRRGRGGRGAGGWWGRGGGKGRKGGGREERRQEGDVSTVV